MMFEKLAYSTVIISVLLCFGCRPEKRISSGVDDLTLRGWSVLTNDPAEIHKAIARAENYNINHLQLSHDIIMDLREVKAPQKRKEINALVHRAHEAGIAEVTVWDHALYTLDYYPDHFKTGPQRTLDLDNPDFWEWFKQDYRDMMALVPDVDGLILTFVETGARAERQHSVRANSEAEKLAMVINNIADVLIGELGKKLYIRTFAYDDSEYEVTIGCIDHLRWPEIILMMKETPHDFFLTHPSDKFAGMIDRPTIIEFDLGNEFNGQGVIANTWVEHVVNRWSDFSKRKNIIGYVARTDRYSTTSAIGRPSEILLYALKRCAEDTSVSAASIYEEFITKVYGEAAVPFLKPAFSAAFDIVTSSLYTLGTNTANHSKLDFDPYPSSYARHVTGKWVDPPVTFVEHRVNREFHYWTDVVEHLAPARLKTGGQLAQEAPYVLANSWVTPEERMTEEFLNYVVTEKKYAVEQATIALENVVNSKSHVLPEKYDDLYQTFYRTWLTARLYEAVAKTYFGYRVYARGESYRTRSLNDVIHQGLDELLAVCREIENYREFYPKGQWDWKQDRVKALEYHRKITSEGWPEYGGVVFQSR